MLPSSFPSRSLCTLRSGRLVRDVAAPSAGGAAQHARRCALSGPIEGPPRATERMLNVYEPLFCPWRCPTPLASGPAPPRNVTAKHAPPLIRGGPVVGRSACGGWRRQQRAARAFGSRRSPRLLPTVPGRACVRCPSLPLLPPRGCSTATGRQAYPARRASGDGGRAPAPAHAGARVGRETCGIGVHASCCSRRACTVLAALLPPAPPMCSLHTPCACHRPCCPRLEVHGLRASLGQQKEEELAGGHSGPLSADLWGDRGRPPQLLLPCQPQA